MRLSRLNTQAHREAFDRAAEEKPDVPALSPRLALPSCQRAFQGEESISNLDTALMFSIRPERTEQQQQEILITTMVEDITRLATLQLPAVALKAEQEARSDQQRVITGTAGSAALAGGGDLMCALLRYVTNVVMTNMVSQSLFGTYVAAYTTVTITSNIVKLGLDATLLRFLSTYHVKGEYSLIAGLIRFVLWMTLISGLLCGILFYFSAPLLAHWVYHQDAYALPLKEVSLLVPLIALQLVLASGLQALKAIKWKVYIDRLIQPGLTLIFTGVFFLLGLRLEALILSTTCGFLASVLVGQFLLHKASRQIVQGTKPRFEREQWLRFAFPLFFNSIVQNILSSTDILFLTALTTVAQVGLYGAADRVSAFILMPLFALNTIFSPIIAEYYATEKYEQLANLSRVVTKWAFSLSFPIFLCFCIFHDSILGIFSKEYTVGGTVLMILSLGCLIDAGVGSVGYLLTMTGHARVILVNTVVTMTVNIGLALFLVPRFNVIGAAVATAAAEIILNVAGLIEVYVILKILTLRLSMLKPVVAGGVASVLGLLLLHVIHPGYGYRALVGTLGMVIPFLLVYIFVLALLGFSEEDRLVFRAVYTRLSRKGSKGDRRL